MNIEYLLVVKHVWKKNKMNIIIELFACYLIRMFDDWLDFSPNLQHHSSFFTNNIHDGRRGIWPCLIRSLYHQLTNIYLLFLLNSSPVSNRTTFIWMEFPRYWMGILLSDDEINLLIYFSIETKQHIWLIDTDECIRCLKRLLQKVFFFSIRSSNILSFLTNWSI